MLKLFRLHKHACVAERYDRSYRRCKCPIHVEGMLGGEMVRESLKTANWQRASATITEAEARGTWKDPEAKPKSLPIVDAVQAFIADSESRLRPPSVKKYRVLLDRERTRAFDAGKHSPTLVEFCASRGMVALSEIEVSTMREFRQAWKDGHLAATKKLERLRSFFRFCMESGWIAADPAKNIKPPLPTEAEQCPTLPFEPDEVKRMRDSMAAFAASRAGRGAASESDHIERFSVLLLVMEHSGLSISDATKLDTTQINGDRLFLRRMKTGTRVMVPLPGSVAGALAGLKPYQGKYYFWTGQGSIETAAGNYRRTLRKLGEHAKVLNAHPHRFRDTFAVRLLQQGVPLERVSKLLGHQSVKITEQHYWPWIQSLQDQLEDDVRKVWAASISDTASGGEPGQEQTAESAR